MHNKIMNQEGQSTEQIIFNSFLEEYDHKVLPQVTYQLSNYREVATTIIKQLKLRQVQLTSSIKTHEEVIASLKEFAEEILMNWEGQNLVVEKISEEDNKRIQKIVKWFKNLNHLKDNNERILLKKIKQLQDKIKLLQGKVHLSEVETYKDANQSLLRINKNLGNKIVLMTQTSQNHIGQVKEVYEMKIKQLQQRLKNTTGLTEKSCLTSNEEASTQTMQKYQNYEYQVAINQLTKENKQYQKRMASLREEIEKQRNKIQIHKYQQLTQQLNNERNKLTKISAQLQLMTQSNEKQAATINQLYQQRHKLQQQNSQMNSYISRITSQSQNQIVIGRTKEHNYQQQLQQLSYKHQQLQQANSEQQTIIQQQQQQLRQLVTEQVQISNLKEKIIALERSNHTLRKEMINDQETSRKIEKNISSKLEQMTHSLAKSKASEKKYHLSLSRVGVEEGHSLTERKPIREDRNLYRSGIFER